MNRIEEVRKRESWSSQEDSILKEAGEIRRDRGREEGIASHQDRQATEEEVS